MTIEKESDEDKKIFMRARTGTINITFSTTEEMQKWKDRIASSLKEGGLNVREE